MADDASLRGRTALITGGSRGIGLAIANALAGCGATLVITGRDTARLASAADEIERTHGGKVHTVSLDLADGSSVAPAFQIIRAAAGQIDILVNNAGEAASAPLLRTDTAHKLKNQKLKKSPKSLQPHHIVIVKIRGPIAQSVRAEDS